MMIFTTTPNKPESKNTIPDKKKTAAKAGDIFVRLSAVLFWIGVWWACSAAVGKEILLPSPHAVLRRLFDPLLSIIKATPVASFIILALVWIKSMLMPVFIAFLIVLPIVCSNIYGGLRSTDRQLIEMCDMYGITGTKRLTALYLPSAVSYALAAGRSALGLAWKAGVAAEVIGRTSRSVGNMLYQSKLYLETVDLFAWTAAVVILSRVLEAVMFRLAGALSRRFSLSADEEPENDNG